MRSLVGPADVWTRERIAVVIQGLTGVQLLNPSVWRLLRGRLGWSMQRPERQAKERDEKAIQQSVAHEWPRIKRARAESAWIVFFDDSGISLIPPVRRIWSPRGTTPILHHRVAWKRASMAAAPGYHPGGTRASGTAGVFEPIPLGVWLNLNCCGLPELLWSGQAAGLRAGQPAGRPAT